MGGRVVSDSPCRVAGRGGQLYRVNFLRKQFEKAHPRVGAPSVPTEKQGNDIVVSPNGRPGKSGPGKNICPWQELSKYQV